MLGVPLLREGRALGVIVVGWAESGPVPNVQEELLNTFAAQAVIAIENVRLFQELEAKNRGLTEALARQTATAEIFRVISSSPTGLQSVLNAVVERAARLCDSNDALIRLADGDGLRRVAHFGSLRDPVATNIHPIVSNGVGSRAFLERRAIHVHDIVEEFRRGNYPDGRPLQEQIGYRTVLGVPLLRGDAAIGVILIRRMIVQPFTDKQIELLETFADQVVIAIELVRLFDEIQSKSRQLELANTYKSRFLAAASHDLRQPLHALNLFVAQLGAESDPIERDRLVTRIDVAVNAMNELFNSLLDMSKLDAGILELELTEFPAGQLLQHIETTFAEAARAKGLRLRVMPSSAWIRSDFILLERILLNLVSNAVSYTTRGGVVVGARRRGERLRLDVWDSGRGIPEDHQQNIFREFYQLAGPEPDRRGGLGLGLAIVDRLGSLLDHPVELKSHPGKGSRFSVSVPLAAQGHRSAAEAPVPPATIADPVAGKLIVVIDDDALVLDGMRGLLQSWSCRVVTEASETAALARLASLGQQPDLIICDHRLADGKTGIGAIDCLRGTLGVATPAFLISGDTAPERLREASASGFQLLHKPVRPMALRAVLNRLLKSRDDAGATTQTAK